MMALADLLITTTSICSGRDKNIIFFFLTSPICPIFTHNDIKHAKLQEVKRVSNLVSDFLFWTL